MKSPANYLSSSDRQKRFFLAAAWFYPQKWTRNVGSRVSNLLTNCKLTHFAKRNNTRNILFNLHTFCSRCPIIRTSWVLQTAFEAYKAIDVAVKKTAGSPLYQFLIFCGTTCPTTGRNDTQSVEFSTIPDTTFIAMVPMNANTMNRRMILGKNRKSN